MKKIFIISAVLLVVVLIFLGIYNFAFKKESTVSKQEVALSATTDVKTATAPTAFEKITAISEEAVLGPVVDKKTEEIKYYDVLTGLVWRMDADGQKKKQTTNTKIVGLKRVTWSPDHNKVLTTVQKDGQTFFYEYDYLTQKAVTLKSGLDMAVWDNMGTKILYKYFNAASQERTLNIANPDGSDWHKLADLKAKNITIAPVPLSSMVSYWNSPSAAEETQLQIVGAVGGEAKTVLAGRYGADYLWSPAGNVALVSSLPNREAKIVTLGTVTPEGDYQDLNIPTLASKCVWSEDSKTVYYALPGEIPSEATMPNDYQENKFNTADTFWRVDIATGKKERIIETVDIKGKYDASGMFLSATGDALYFVNKADKKLYRIEL